MDYKAALVNGIGPDADSKEHEDARSGGITSYIQQVPVTVQRKPFVQPEDDARLSHTGTPRANIAATYEQPHGSQASNWAKAHQNQTVLQQHCDYFDQDKDGIIWPLDTYKGLRGLGWNFLLCLFATFIIHVPFSYPTVPGHLPDPFFRIYLRNIHKTKHGSDTGTYDNEGRFVPQKFEDMFSKYAADKDYVTLRDVWHLLKGQRVVADPFGTTAAALEWLATYILLWPEDGRMKKEDIRKLYDGSIFYEIAKERKHSGKR
ncbi:putative peroxygenase 3 [Trichoderma ghanense]|uniref:Peroxygenase 3 n=1 Tax=Trichoderma ghanense TaxID=65468 RepID=A0ABY2H5A0_9HYPO